MRVFRIIFSHPESTTQKAFKFRFFSSKMVCIFCKIATGETPSEKIYEDAKFIAFLDIRPGTEGQTLVIPKKHYGSYVFDMPEKDYIEILKVARKVGKQLDKALGSDRTCLVLEGLEINHAHVRLHPHYKNRPFTILPSPWQAPPELLKQTGNQIRKTTS